MFHNALDIAETVRQLLDEGWEIALEDLAHISPYLTEHIKRRVQHTRTQRPARGIRPEARLRLHPSARAGSDGRRPRPGRLTAPPRPAPPRPGGFFLVCTGRTVEAVPEVRIGPARHGA
ncbi:Tn3 family transposase [Streptomyces sp. NPDC058107]|uniref:Tn3 family transposase n=1 Tax=Streptomyces sp. NPDC058107 TaxID=3346343 RepID=UPI0036ECF6F1